MKESPIFSKTYDFVVWLIPVTIKFPRAQRFVMADILQREALRFQELLIEAVHQPQPRERLHKHKREILEDPASGRPQNSSGASHRTRNPLRQPSRPRRVLWLCVPASRRVCRYRRFISCVPKV